MRLLVSHFVCLLITAPAWSQNAISLSKPVSESLKPDVLYWSFDDGTPDTSHPELIEDHSDHGHVGQLVAGSLKPEPVYVEGKFGTALYFHGRSPFVTAPNGKEVPSEGPSVVWSHSKTPAMWEETKLDMNGQSFTAGAWIKLNSIREGGRQTIYLMDRGMGPSQWSFELRKAEDDQWIFRALNVSSAQTTALNDEGWHHVAFSVESGPDSSTVTFWLDGQELGLPVEARSRIAAPEQPRERTFRVGERNVAFHSTGFDGVLDDVFVTSGVHTFQP